MVEKCKSWRGFAQECNNCGNGVHAHKQTRLQPREFDLRDFDVFNDFDYYRDKSSSSEFMRQMQTYWTLLWE